MFSVYATVTVQYSAKPFIYRRYTKEDRKNVYFWKDETEKPIWKDTYVYAKLNDSI